MNGIDNLSMLGNKNIEITTPDKMELEIFEISEEEQKSNRIDIWKITEFTTICPKTQQPDYARIIIQIVPNKYRFESKSFKLFCESFRTPKGDFKGSFHEKTVETICKKINNAIKPKYIQVVAIFSRRGNASIMPMYEIINKEVKHYSIIELLNFNNINYGE